MSEPALTGPRLSDARFFADLLDRGRPGVEAAAAAGGDFGEAHRLLAAELRASLQPQRFLRIRRSFSDPGAHLRPGETAAEAAERVLAGELVSCGTPMRFDGEVDWFANPTHNQYREWTWQLSRHPEWGLLAERYRDTADERYAQGFARLLRSWLRQAVVPTDAPGNATRCWRTIEAGIRMGGAWPWALHSFVGSPAFTDDLLVDFLKSVWEHGWRLRHFHRTHNWLIMEMNGLAQIGVLYPQLRDAPAWKAYAFDRLVEELSAQVHPDGFQYELSTNYHQVNIRNYHWLWDVCEATTSRCRQRSATVWSGCTRPTCAWRCRTGGSRTSTTAAGCRWRRWPSGRWSASRSATTSAGPPAAAARAARRHRLRSPSPTPATTSCAPAGARTRCGRWWTAARSASPTSTRTSSTCCCTLTAGCC